MPSISAQKFGAARGAFTAVAEHEFLANGVDLATVSERMGHSSVATTANIYAHAIRGKDRAAAQTWDSIMQRARAEKPTSVN